MMTKIKTSPQSQNHREGKVGRKARLKPVKNTKKAQLISLLSKNTGSDTGSISKKFGWLPHTTRATLSGLRKAGYEISSMKAGTGKPTKYRILGAPREQSAH
jgi:hypothetical protein